MEVCQSVWKVFPVMPMEEKATKDWLLREVARTKQDYPKDTVLQTFFESQVKKNSQRIGVIYQNKEYSFADINQRANQLAWTLRFKGVGPNQVVGINLYRSIEMIIGLLAIIKAGGAFLPIAPDFPQKRIEHMLKDSGAQILLTSQTVQETGTDLHRIYLDRPTSYYHKTGNLPLINGSRDLAYVIYTSGSTGKPKGVMIEHQALINRLDWMWRKYQLGTDSVFLQKTPTIFDVSIWEIFLWTMIGGSVALLEHGYEKFPQAIIQAVYDHQVTILHFIPSMLNEFLNYVRHSGKESELRSLKWVIVSGEELLVEHVNKFHQILFQTNQTRLANLYGPTEAAIDVTYYDCPTCRVANRIPIGRPIQNIALCVMKSGKVQPPENEGELCIMGDGLARGYIGSEKLTRDKFIPNPLLPEVRMYRTGDVARIKSDGMIHYLGRVDDQVKIRGMRIELGEIESILIRHGEVNQCAVLVEGEKSNRVRLKAFVVGSERLTRGLLRAYLAAELPTYMVPDEFIFLHHLPRTKSGKINRKKLKKDDSYE